ncbi:phosphoenolpyruvate--protein phosphotransferase [Saccharopolyspora erythraea NRRL 2338]|uniref:Phosphoenolpyruvate-protein phosphotransferase n=1 Tax=Saccharopolyspora erythraea (strain ATCC 11635 / DSM 40517 / JCM 4748 / NBRC 13426 / NCIMB 8594 / NRRL 2338) TaxID=405948 RepID=A4FC01_SACEN|nr:putative PEP-binding protein [Saccharopolyspora erythraea]EQD84072.1 phosphoenolpyruvate-protein phosphotransferase [Saccharopolyspora erythraea D]PFG95348.1 phosphoenolpyruvate--protein phosphotransferase [Saccharopolyspora erythraea NRRL 2338]QRK91990.1 phosphoenolpyruvate--protein phosphotransferase [Saccharopolyspora erythraea]CAM01576.1 putative phosphoenolpyruvate-protein phosphotransferase enzyme I [Saccharopolyspora erythraea NRRL 2338]
MTTTTAHGVGVSPGQVSGPVARVEEPLPEPKATPAPADRDQEAARIGPAAAAVARRLAERAESVKGEARAILETTSAMAGDPTLLANAEKLVRERGLPAPRAVFEAAEEFAALLASAGGYLAERVRDVRDVADRLIAELTGTAPPGVPELSGPAVLVARDLAPADTADLDPRLVLALVTEEGGPTGHTAILARSLGIPAVVAARGVLAAGAVGARVDGDTGEVELSDEPVAVQVAQRPAQRPWDGVGRTADGHPVKVLANIGSATDAAAAAAAGAEGVGLFRTEFCFLAATSEPGVEAQRAAYAEALAPFAGKPVVVRTLDAGADKPLPFLSATDEPNPALGVRGIRVAFDRPEIVDRQLEAIAGAAADTGAEVSVMAPMVATADEAAWFARRARAAGITRAGVMIEVPAAALSAAEVLDAVDFVSIGTNDLAQYTFAADRMLGALAQLNDPWQPALLRLVELVARAGRERGKPVGVCGEAAADGLLAGVLAGLGVTSLSMVTAALGAVGASLAEHSMATCEQAARTAVATAEPAQARQAARDVLHR